MSNKVLTSAQAAQRFGVTPRTIQRCVAAGVFSNAYKLDPSYIKSPFIIPVEDVESFEEKRRERLAAATEEASPQKLQPDALRLTSATARRGWQPTGPPPCTLKTD